MSVTGGVGGGRPRRARRVKAASPDAKKKLVQTPKRTPGRAGAGGAQAGRTTATRNVRGAARAVKAEAKKPQRGKPRDAKDAKRRARRKQSTDRYTTRTIRSVKAERDLKVAGVNIDKITGGAGRTALTILEQTARPLHAQAAMVRETINPRKAGEPRRSASPARIFKAGVQGFKNERKDTYSDALGDLGVKNGVAKYGGGLVLDIALDPLTYASVGASIPAKVAAAKKATEVGKRVTSVQTRKARRTTTATPRSRSVEERATEEMDRQLAKARGRAERRGRKLTDRQEQQIRRQVEARHGARPEKELAARAQRRTYREDPRKNRGLTVGTRKHHTSGRATSAISRTIGLSATARRAKESDIVQDVGAAARPDFKKRGVDRGAAETVHAAEAEFRSAVATGERKLQALARTYRKKFGESDYERMIDAVEAGRLSSLGKRGDDLYEAGLTLRSHFRHMNRLDRQAGVRAAQRDNYVSHIRRQDVEDTHLDPTPPRQGRPARGGSSAKRRKDTRTHAEKRAADPSRVTSDIPSILARRGPETVKGVADVRVLRTLVETGRRLLPEVKDPKTGKVVRESTKIDSAREAVYHVPAKSSVPREVTDGDEVARALDGKGQAGQYVVLNRQLAEDTIKARTRPEVGGLHKRYRKAHGVTKTLLTVPMPSYHARNLYGDTSNASYNLNAAELTQALGASAKVLKVRRGVKKREGSIVSTQRNASVSDATVKIGGRRVLVEDLIREMEQAGAINTGFSRELREMVGESAEGRFNLSKARNVGETRENLVRVATYIGARRQGLTAREAAKRVRDTHFDYLDLTRAERGARDVLPFYTFAARNTPLQVKTLAARPGKLARYEKLIEEGANAAGFPNDWRDKLKEYEAYGIPMPMFGMGIKLINGEKLPLVALAGLPITDLNRLTPNPLEQAKQLASMVTVWKAVLELPFNYSVFFRDKIDRGRKVNAPDWVGSLALPEDVRKELGIELVFDKEEGRKVWKWKAKWDYLFKQLPETSFVLNATTSAKNRRDQDQTLKLLSLSGVRPQPFDELAADVDKAHDRLTGIQNRLKAVRDAGASAEKPTPRFERLRRQEDAIQRQIWLLTRRQKRRGEAVKVPKSYAPPKEDRSLGGLLDPEKKTRSLNELLGNKSGRSLDELLNR